MAAAHHDLRGERARLATHLSLARWNMGRDKPPLRRPTWDIIATDLVDLAEQLTV
jgi:hypothetical protein